LTSATTTEIDRTAAAGATANQKDFDPAASKQEG
jgi:hypothetical protein